MAEIDWDTDFDPGYGILTLNKLSYVYFRGYDKSYPVISDRPAYFGSLSTAKGYGEKNPDRSVSAFTNKRPLKLLDVRFMKDILRDLFTKHTNADLTSILPVILSFGLCSLRHQIGLAKMRFSTTPLLTDHVKSLEDAYKPGLYEQSGYRIAETTNDAFTMAFLKSLFAGFVDGFISPRMYSPFHIEKKTMFNGEMILFNPARCQIVCVDDYDIRKQGPKQSIDELYNRELGRKIHVGSPPMSSDFFLKTGGGIPDTYTKELPSVEQINMRFHEREIQDEWNKGLAVGNEWSRLSRFGEYTNPVPTADRLGEWPIESSALSIKRRTTRKQRRQ